MYTKEDKPNIGKNAVIMYIRMAIIMVINLYTVRVVLNSIGSIDYGLYDVVAGVVTVLASISGVLSSTSQRYFSFAIGKGDGEELKKVFSVTFVIYFLIAVLVLLLGEGIGVWFINNHLQIPQERLVACNWIFQFALFSFVCSLIQSPFVSTVVSYENMGVFAIISIAECVLKFLFALSISFVSIDKLIFYGGYLLLISIIILCTYVVFCKIKYSNCQVCIVRDYKLYRELIAFSGWTLLGSLAGTSIFQINTILTNIFFGPIVSASRAIAIQVYSAFNSFANNFLMVVKPPLIKKYASSEYDSLNTLFSFSNKFVYYGLLIICVPLLFEMETILKIWLKTGDPLSSYFARIVIVYTIIMAIGGPITYIIQATGKVKQYFTVVEIFTLLCAPVTYLLFWLGFEASAAFWVMSIAALLSHCMRIYCINKYYSGFNLIEYIRSFVIPALIITVSCCLVSLYACHHIESGVVRFFILFFINFFVILLLVISIGFSNKERQYLKYVIIKRKFR